MTFHNSHENETAGKNIHDKFEKIAVDADARPWPMDTQQLPGRRWFWLAVVDSAASEEYKYMLSILLVT